MDSVIELVDLHCSAEAAGPVDFPCSVEAVGSVDSPCSAEGAERLQLELVEQN
jgi:hypothetical protein